MNLRSLRPWGESEHEGLFAKHGRPKERRPISWSMLLWRLLALTWASTVTAALIDEFGLAPHLPLMVAMGMTGLMLGVSLLLTRADELDAPHLGRGASEDGARDLLTGLPTFNYFSRRLHEEFGRTRRMGRRIAIVLVDVNNLTAVNKEYGVRAGDEVLRHVANVIDNTRRYSDIAARLGDDEFGVLLIDTGEEGIAAFVRRLEDRLARDAAQAEVDGRQVSLWAGICSGSAASTPGMTAADAVLEAAMESLDNAKQDRERRRRMWLSA